MNYPQEGVRDESAEQDWLSSARDRVLGEFEKVKGCTLNDAQRQGFFLLINEFYRGCLEPSARAWALNGGVCVTLTFEQQMLAYVLGSSASILNELEN